MTVRLAAALAAILAAAPAASAAESFAPMQAVVGDIGDKLVVAYYELAAERCALTVMVDESAAGRDDDVVPATTGAARVRVHLVPGEAASVESAVGGQVAFTCGPDAVVMLVERQAPGRKLASR